MGLRAFRTGHAGAVVAWASTSWRRRAASSAAPRGGAQSTHDQSLAYISPPRKRDGLFRQRAGLGRRHRGDPTPLRRRKATGGVAKTTLLRRWPSKAAVAAAALQRLALQAASPLAFWWLDTATVAIIATEIVVSRPFNHFRRLVASASADPTVARQVGR